jgi:hypothetical protein
MWYKVLAIVLTISWNIRGYVIPGTSYLFTISWTLTGYVIQGTIYFIYNIVKLYRIFDTINILPLIEGVMVDYHTQKTNIIRDEVEGDIAVFWVW